jgi:hypothetical protein
LEILRDAIIECYDANRDGRIEVTEMTKFLPVENNFLLHFRYKLLAYSDRFKPCMSQVRG